MSDYRLYRLPGGGSVLMIDLLVRTRNRRSAPLGLRVSRMPSAPHPEACRRQNPGHGSPKRSAPTSRAPCTTRTMITSVSVKR